MNELEIIELVNKALYRDNLAMEVLYNSYYKDVLYVCKKLNLNDADAHDIAQDTFIDAFSKLSTLNDKSKFKQWVCRIANNKALNLLKHNNVIQFDNIDADDSYIEIPDKEMCVEEQIIEVEVANTLRNIIEKLPLEQKITIFMFYYEDMSIKEIAAAYNCSENTVKSRLSYAKKFIGQEVDKLENNGIKLRCTALLPFLYLLFTQEQKAFAALIPSNAIPTATAVIAKTMKAVGANITTPAPAVNVVNTANITNTMNTTNTTSTASVATTAAKTFSIGKLIGISVAAVTLISATIIGIVLLNSNDNDNENKPIKIESPTTMDSSNSDVTSNKDSDEDDTTIANKEDEKIDYATGDEYWDYYPMDVVSLPEITYTKIEYIDGFSANIADTFFTLTPEEVAEKVKESTFYKRQDHILTSDRADGCKIYEYTNIGIQKQYSTTHYISTYPKSHVEDVMSESNYSYYDFDTDLSISMSIDYANYNTPDEITISMKNINVSRDEQLITLELLTSIFGEDLAKYLVYAQDDDVQPEDDSPTNKNINVDIETNDTKYTLIRTIDIGDKDEPNTGNIYFTVKVTHKKVNIESYYAANYNGILSDDIYDVGEYFLGNFGETNINNIRYFGSEYMKIGLEEIYVKTVCDGFYYQTGTLPDGTINTKINVFTQKGCDNVANTLAPELDLLANIIWKDDEISSYNVTIEGNLAFKYLKDGEEKDYTNHYEPYINQLKAILGNDANLSSLTLENFLTEEEISFDSIYLGKPCTVTINHDFKVNVAHDMTGDFTINIITK